MFLFLYRFFYGYLYLRFTSESPEKLLNICAANGIIFWRASLKNNTLYFKIGISEFKKLRRLKRMVKGKIHIIKKYGLPFILAKNKYRYGMIAGAVIFAFTLWYLSGFIWNITICGTEDISVASVMESLEEIGIYEGVRTNKIIPENARNQLIIKRNDIAWAAFNIEGCKLTVDLTETKKYEKNSNEPSNLKASEDGVVKAVEIIKGTANVRVGDAVRKGDLLVSGILEFQDFHTEFVRARANIIAETEKNFSFSIPLNITEEAKTGKKFNRNVLEFFGIKFPLYLGNLHGDFAVERGENNSNTEKSYIPIRVNKNTYYEVKKVKRRLSMEEAKKIADNEALKVINDYVGEGKITQKNITITEIKNQLMVNIEIKCEKNIILEEKLILNTGN